MRMEFCKRQIESKNMSENSHMRMLRPSQQRAKQKHIKINKTYTDIICYLLLSLFVHSYVEYRWSHYSNMAVPFS